MNRIPLAKINRELKKKIGGVRLVRRDNPDRPVALIFARDDTPIDIQMKAVEIVNRHVDVRFYLDEAKVTE